MHTPGLDVAFVVEYYDRGCLRDLLFKNVRHGGLSIPSVSCVIISWLSPLNCLRVPTHSPCCCGVVVCSGPPMLPFRDGGSRFLRVMSDMIAGLNHVHSHHFVHRDVAARNMLVSHTGWNSCDADPVSSLALFSRHSLILHFSCQLHGFDS